MTTLMPTIGTTNEKYTFPVIREIDAVSMLKNGIKE
jgi:hypothetical protein